MISLTRISPQYCHLRGSLIIDLVIRRNDATANIEYEFGPHSKVTAGYVYNILDNQDPTLQDVTEKGPFLGLSHQFDSKNSLAFDYRFAEYRYTQSGSSEPGPDIEVQDVGLIYSYRYSERYKALFSVQTVPAEFHGN